jgi:predicted nucleic acid-binding Zn ribbon protein
MRPPRKQTTQPLADIISEIMGAPNLSRGIYQSRIPAAWEEVMGKSVARITRNVFFRNGVLFVSLNSSTIRSELLMHKNKIIHNLNQKIGQTIVKDLILK